MRNTSPVRTASLFAVLTAGCTPSVQGDEIGTYRVRMSLVENTCGAGAIHNQDGHSYTVQLRAKDGQGYWRVGGQKPLLGSYDQGNFSFTFESLVAHSAPDASIFCQLMQSDQVSGVASLESSDAGTADAGADAATEDTDAATAPGSPPPHGLTGQHVFMISAVAGTDCTEALTPIGPFERLPCKVRYTLEGTPAESF
jgi:hypothetical protein